MEDVDVVIPYCGGEPWEAQQAIRLLKKHFKPLRNIYSIGVEIPGTINIPYVETDKKEINIWRKVLTATFIEGLSDTFLFMNDDHFIQEDFKNIPNFATKTLRECPAEAQYKEAVDRTIEELEKRGLNTYNFDCHTPIFFEKQKFQEVFLEFNPVFEVVMKSCYCNYFGFQPVEYEDMKIKNLVDKHWLMAHLPGKFCFSTHESLITRDLREYVESL